MFNNHELKGEMGKENHEAGWGWQRGKALF